MIQNYVFRRYEGDTKRYNLNLVDKYKSELLFDCSESSDLDEMNDVVIRIPMPARSLIVLYGSPRYRWEHSVLREDIQTRRVCIAYREFTPDYLKNGSHFNESSVIFQKSQLFWPHNIEQHV